MKIEFERISEIMYTLLKHQPVIDVPYEKINDIAVALVKEGYGNVTEYKAEIERLKDEIIYLERKIAIRDNALKDRDKAIEMLESKQDTIVKQAKIDVLNELKERIKTAIDTYFNLDGGGYYLAEDAIDDIDGLIEEVENNDKRRY